ncbi:hypothetical protein GDO81_029179 [Engystomops pustulosus]|uniref:TIL domain-containing protein n=1 Tax=Engystomops pustulosus TaxID=76066 RepID=A0AAV6ZRH1_ENGPU|nr:hypothetical protein GDO81_029179 [Engystomops pustulosus]
MRFFMLSAVFLVAMLQWKVASDSTPECPENSTYKETGVCYLRCDNIETYSPEDICIALAVSTCKCNDGFLAQVGTNGTSVQCVRPKECNITCSENKHLVTFASGCQPTCDNPTTTDDCDIPCRPQCVCNKGYVLSGEKCVKPCECPTKA